jgi:hypothetical protein
MKESSMARGLIKNTELVDLFPGRSVRKLLYLLKYFSPSFFKRRERGNLNAVISSHICRSLSTSKVAQYKKLAQFVALNRALNQQSWPMIFRRVRFENCDILQNGQIPPSPPLFQRGDFMLPPLKKGD